MSSSHDLKRYSRTYRRTIPLVEAAETAARVQMALGSSERYVC